MSPRLNKAIQKARIAAREASLSPHSKRVRKAARKAENRATRLVTKQLLAKQFSFSEWSEELKICHADFARLKRLASREGNNCDRVLLLELSLASYKRALVTVLRNTAEVEEGCAARCGMRVEKEIRPTGRLLDGASSAMYMFTLESTVNVIKLIKVLENYLSFTG